MADEIKKLIDLAIKAREKAYAPYSRYKVGAAVKTKTGKIFTGCNIENVSLGGTICAERVAVAKALSEGEREIEIVVVVTDSPQKIASPCGICRQFIYEFGPQAKVVKANLQGKFEEVSINNLLPDAFDKRNLN